MKLSGLILLLVWVMPPSAFSQTTIEKARLLFDGKKIPEAKTLLKTVKEGDKDYAEAQYYLGRIAFDAKEFDDAADYFEEATDANDKVADYYNWLGNTYGTIAQDANPFKQGLLAPKMKSAWEKTIALDAKNIEARSSLIQFYTQAPGFMGGSMDKAREMARQIIALNPAQGHRSMGNILVQEKKIPEAEKEYLEMFKADPAYLPVLGSFYSNQKQFDKAFALFEEQAKKNASDMGILYQIGRTSAVSGQRLDRGEECLKKYLQYTPKENEPSLAGANMRMGQIVEKKGLKAEAKKYYETALRLNDKLKEAEEGLKRTSQ